MEKFQKIIDNVNDGEIEQYIKYFGSIENFIKFLVKTKIIDYIEPFNESLDEHQNLIIWSLLNSGNEEVRQNTYEKIISLLDDVEKSGDEYYYIPDGGEIEVLANFFQTYSRDTSPYDVAKAVLSEDYWEPFWDTTYDVYRDVIEELNPENKQILKNKILELLKGKKIELDGSSSDEMELIASEQGHEDYIEVTPENIDRIVNDEDTMDFLLNSELRDIKNDLENIHQGAYNDAYNNEYYGKVWDELSTYFDGRPEWVQSGKKYIPKLKVTKNIHTIIDDYLSAHKNYGYQYSLAYNGTLYRLIDELFDYGDYEKLSFRINDYPDFYNVKKNINLNFKDYF